MYVSSVTADPSGNPVTMPGKKYLLISLNPAQGHNDAGVSTVLPRSAMVGYPMLKGFTVVGDYEGYLTVALGLDATVPIRVGELSGRVYIDVSY